MMKGFDAIELEWDGETYSVPATSQMELILRVETGLIAGRDTQAFKVLTQRSGPPMALFAKVYADALIYAGARVTHIEVFRTLSENLHSGDGGLFIQAQHDMLKILGLLAPEGGEEKPKAKPGKKTKSAGA